MTWDAIMTEYPRIRIQGRHYDLVSWDAIMTVSWDAIMTSYPGTPL